MPRLGPLMKPRLTMKETISQSYLNGGRRFVLLPTAEQIMSTLFGCRPIRFDVAEVDRPQRRK